MNVNDDTIKGLIEGLKQFEVPIWQRQYTWQVEQHEQLWNDLKGQYESLAGTTPAETGHFFGSVVLAPRDPAATGVSHFQVIDGQQRLTTLMLLLCAIRDVVALEDESAVERYNDLYLINRYAEDGDRYRLLPGAQDREAFLRWVLRDPDNGSGDLISKAYRFYRKQIESLRAGTGLDLDRLTTAALERLEIVEITTQSGDNVHRIFQSLNGTGLPLSQADLLRNHLFMLLPSRADRIYAEVWRPMEEDIGVANLEGLARLDLLRRGKVVRRSQVYLEHARLLGAMEGEEAAVEARIRDLSLRASFYKRLIDPTSEPDPEARPGLQRLARWGAQTSHPVLMMALDLRHREIISDSDFARVVALVESFLVRRQIGRIPTNAHNRLFIALIPRLPEDGQFVETLHYELSRDRFYWLDDDEIRNAVKRVPFFHVGRGHQRKMILERLERSFGHPEVVDFDEADLQEEHIMPQTLSMEWREHLQSLGDDPDEVHGELVHTLGNLTLTAFNGTLSNSPFDRKAEIYGDSHLELNRALAEGDAWGREQILARAETLAAKIAEVWPAPVEGPTSDPGSFDWSRIDAAIAAVPPGRWTTYGDLAELGGTAAMPVGGYVRELPSGSNAYRVLRSDGSVSDGFQWDDPTDMRNVEEVLVAEGISFNDGRAAQEQHLSTEELASLIDEPEDQLD